MSLEPHSAEYVGAEFEVVGVDYCLTHHGLRNEDESRCAWQDRRDPDHRCARCEGQGVLIDPDGEAHDCDEDCDDGMTPCDLRPLGWMRGEADRGCPGEAVIDRMGA